MHYVTESQSKALALKHVVLGRYILNVLVLHVTTCRIAPYTMVRKSVAIFFYKMAVDLLHL